MAKWTEFDAVYEVIGRSLLCFALFILSPTNLLSICDDFLSFIQFFFFSNAPTTTSLLRFINGLQFLYTRMIRNSYLYVEYTFSVFEKKKKKKNVAVTLSNIHDLSSRARSNNYYHNDEYRREFIFRTFVRVHKR